MSRVRVKTVVELMAALPIDYVYLVSGSYLNSLRFMRLLKAVRLPDSNAKLRAWFSNYHIYNIIRLITFSLLFTHISACIYHVVAKYEYDTGGRFDHTSFVLFNRYW